MNQVDKPNRFLLFPSTGLKIPRCQADYSLLCQYPANLMVVMTLSQNGEASQHPERCPQNQGVISPKWEPGLELLLDSETQDPPVARDAPTVICFLQGLSDLYY